MRGGRIAGTAAMLIVAFVSTVRAVVFYEHSSILEDLSEGQKQHSFSHHGDNEDEAWEERRCDWNGTTTAISDAGSSLLMLPRLHDRTLEVSPCVRRPWVVEPTTNDDNDDDATTVTSLLSKLSALWVRRDNTVAQTKAAPHAARRPPYKVLLTDFGWNHPDPSKGLNVTRSIRSRELVTGIINHPYFDPVDWYVLNKQIEARSSLIRSTDTTRYYVFLDVETCASFNYPVYGGRLETNLDRVGGRVARRDRVDKSCVVAAYCPSIGRVLDSPLFRTHPNHTLLMYFDCRGNSIPRSQRHKLNSDQFALASYSAGTEQHDPRVDQGLAPPAVTKVVLTTREVRDIETCDAEHNRTYLFSFVGSVRNRARGKLVKLHDASRGIISLPLGRYQQELASGVIPVNFTDLLRQSVFSGAPIGDNRFSYRFAEVLGAGAIPVVHSDGWVLPFRPELVNWSECLLHLPESSIPRTIEILSNVTLEKRCRMRQRCRDIYTTYMLDGVGTVRGIVDGMELVWASKATRGSGAAPRRLPT